MTSGSSSHGAAGDDFHQVDAVAVGQGHDRPLAPGHDLAVDGHGDRSSVTPRLASSVGTSSAVAGEFTRLLVDDELHAVPSAPVEGCGVAGVTRRARARKRAAARRGSGSDRMAEITAIPAQPVASTSSRLSTVMPPMASTGTSTAWTMARQLGQAARRQAGVRGGREDVAEGQIVGACRGRGTASSRPWTERPTSDAARRERDGGVDGQALAGEVHPVGADGQRHVQPIVDRQVRAVLAAPRAAARSRLAEHATRPTPTCRAAAPSRRRRRAPARRARISSSGCVRGSVTRCS